MQWYGYDKQLQHRKYIRGWQFERTNDDQGPLFHSWSVKKPRRAQTEAYTDWVFKDTLLYWAAENDFSNTTKTIAAKHLRRIKRRVRRVMARAPGDDSDE